MLDQLQLNWLGVIDYGAAWELQKELVAARTADPDLPHKLLLLEHTPTYTLGLNGDEANLLLDEAARARRGVSLYRVDRGGDITYHGPGQLVAYPILYLERFYGRGIGRIRRYVADLEEVLIRTLDAFDIPAQRVAGLRGVWVEEAGEMNKIAAIGVHVNQSGISSHGIALNVHTDLSYFQGIVPCGITGHGVTSMSAFLGRAVSLAELLPVYSQAFISRFGLVAQEEGMTYAHG